MPPIPEPRESSRLNTLLTDAVAELPSEEEAPEVKPFKISFADYKSNECEISSGLTKDNGAVALKVLRDVGVHFTDEANFNKNVSSEVREVKYITRSGDYRNPYRGLDPDKEVREIVCNHLKKKVDFRIFFYTLETERTFYVLAVRQSHYDTTKSKF